MTSSSVKMATSTTTEATKSPPVVTILPLKDEPKTTSNVPFDAHRQLGASKKGKTSSDWMKQCKKKGKKWCIDKLTKMLKNKENTGVTLTAGDKSFISKRCSKYTESSKAHSACRIKNEVYILNKCYGAGLDGGGNDNGGGGGGILNGEGKIGRRTATIMGSVFGGFFLLILIVCLLWCCCGVDRPGCCPKKSGDGGGPKSGKKSKKSGKTKSKKSKKSGRKLIG